MIEMTLRHIVPAAYNVLPAAMNSPQATAMLLAIALQESKFLHRRQRGGGPARGFWQFERAGGIQGVMEHKSSKGPLSMALTELRYVYAMEKPAELHRIVEDNDVLACVFARLLLWTHPEALPNRNDYAEGWLQYLALWRPGKPKPDTWDSYFIEAWARVDPLRGTL